MELVKIEIIKGSKAQTYYVNPAQIVAIWTEVIDNEAPWSGLWMRAVGMPEQQLLGSWQGDAQTVRSRAEQELDLLRARIQSAASR